MSDVLITPASSKIEFKDASSNIDGVVKLDSDGNLELTSNNGISFGDTSSDVFIGNGTDNVDLKFEADGSITGTSGVTLTLGSSNSNVKLISDELQINATSGVITATTFSGNLNGTLSVVDESSDTSCYPLFVNSSGTGNFAPKTGTNLSFNSSAGQLNATRFFGSFVGQALRYSSTDEFRLVQESWGTNIYASGNQSRIRTYPDVIQLRQNTTVTGILTASSGGSVDFVGIAQSARGISNKPDAGSQTGDTYEIGEGLEEGSQVSIGNTIGMRFDMYYDNYNQFMLLATAGNKAHSNNTSNTRTGGGFKMRTNIGRNNTNPTDTVYGNNAGFSIYMSNADGNVAIGITSGNLGVGGNHNTNGTLYNGLLYDVSHNSMFNMAAKAASYNVRLGRRNSGTMIEFGKSTSLVIGSITCDFSANTTAYNTSSDYRIKENVVGITSALDKINQLRPVNFNFIGNSVKLDGFLAHEVQVVVPYAVTGEKDAVKTVKDGDLSNTGTKEDIDRIVALPTKEVPDYQQVDYSKLVGLLTASIQELSAKNDALEARISALESGGS